MNLTLLPTLQKIALLKLATRVCSIRRYVLEFDERVAIMISTNATNLRLPTSLNRSLWCLFKPILTEICTWIFYIRYIHEEVTKFCCTSCSCLLEIDLQDTLQWLSIGLIDKEQTSLGLIREERLDTAFRFVLACICCSESNILNLWQKLSCDMRAKFHSKFNLLPVVNYWTIRLQKAYKVDFKFIPNPPFPYTFEFDYSYSYREAMYSFFGSLPSLVRYYLFGTYGKSLEDLRGIISNEENINRVTVGLVNVDSVAGLKYFLQRLERIKKQKLLEVVARNHFITNELLVYCISQMSRDQVRELLRSGRRSRVISCLVNSPWQESFWDFLDYIWNDLTADDITEIHSYILNAKVRKEWTDYDYESDANKLWERYLETRGRHWN